MKTRTVKEYIVVGRSGRYINTRVEFSDSEFAKLEKVQSGLSLPINEILRMYYNEGMKYDLSVSEWLDKYVYNSDNESTSEFQAIKVVAKAIKDKDQRDEVLEKLKKAFSNKPQFEHMSELDWAKLFLVAKEPDLFLKRIEAISKTPKEKSLNGQS